MIRGIRERFIITAALALCAGCGDESSTKNTENQTPTDTTYPKASPTDTETSETGANTPVPQDSNDTAPHGINDTGDPEDTDTEEIQSKATDTDIHVTDGSDGTAEETGQELGSDTDSQEEETIIPDTPLAHVKLSEVADCNEAWVSLQKSTIEEMSSRLDSNRDQVIRVLQGDCYDWDIMDGGASMDTSMAMDDDTQEDDTKSAKNYSTTNVQEKDVDEADFIKNDGTYIYVLAGGNLQILKAWPATEAAKLSTTAVEGAPKKLFVHNDRAVVYSSLDPIYSDGAFSDYHYRQGSECTYGYSCDFVGDGHELKITVFDITDKTTPVLLRETLFDNGAYLNSRRIDNAIYTVTVFPEINNVVSGLEYWPQGIDAYNYYYCDNTIPYTEAEVVDLFESLKEQNIERIKAADLSQALPAVRDIKYVNGTAQETDNILSSCPNFSISNAENAKNLLLISGLNTATLEDYTTRTIISKPGAVYADTDSLYIAVRHYKNQTSRWFEGYDTDNELTAIHDFDLLPDETGIEYMGSGSVKGRILNQFSMSEYNNHLRIATTSGSVPNPNVHSTMSILNNQEGALVLTGQIDDIAPTEDIRSARFNGDVGFIVTFKKTDPLFVFDLADPQAPAIVGELKIPGYSTYMHMMDDSHILSIGYDAEDLGSFAYFQGIQLQVLDVTDLTAPALLHKEIIGTRGSTSDAATNHLAFNYFKTLDRLAIPMVICEHNETNTGDAGVNSGNGSQYGDIMTFSGLMVFEVTTENGFNELGRIPHVPAETPENNTGACNNWWTNSNSPVKRSIFMDDYVFAIAEDAIDIAHISNLSTPITVIPLIQ